MSNDNSTEMLAWAANCRALRDELARPILTDQDPRWAELHEEMTSAEYDLSRAVEWGQMYGESCGDALFPAPPFEVPSWATKRKIRRQHPVGIEVWDYGPWVKQGQVRARVFQYRVAVFDHYEFRNGTVEACDITADELGFDGQAPSKLIDLPFAEGYYLGCCITEAAGPVPAAHLVEAMAAGR